MLGARTPFRLSPELLRALSILGVLGLTAVILVAMVGFRDERIGLYVVGGILGAGLGILIFFQPQVGAYTLVITTFSNVSMLFTERGLPSINKPLVALVFVSLVANYFLSNRRREIEFDATEIMLFMWLGLALASSLYAIDRGAVINAIEDLLKDIVIILCVVNAIRTPKQLRTTVWMVIIMAAIMGSLGTFQMLTGSYEMEFWGFATSSTQELNNFTAPRLAGPLRAPNFWAQSMAAVLPLVVYRFFDEKNAWVKAFCVYAAFVIAMTVVGTYSRGAFLAMAATLVVIAIERKVNVGFLAGFAAFMLILLPFLPDTYADRILSLTILTDEESNIMEESSFRGRWNQIQSGLMMFADSPIVGMGIDNYPANYQAYASQLGTEDRTANRDPHSIVLQVMAEGGLVGVTIFGGLITAIGVQLWESRKKAAQHDDESWVTWVTSIGLAVFSYLVSSIFLHMDFFRYFWLLLAIALAMVYMTRLMYRPNDEPEKLAAAS